MKIKTEVHVALINAVERLALGSSVVPVTTIHDHGGAKYVVELHRPSEGDTGSGRDSPIRLRLWLSQHQELHSCLKMSPGPKNAMLQWLEGLEGIASAESYPEGVIVAISSHSSAEARLRIVGAMTQLRVHSYVSTMAFYAETLQRLCLDGCVREKPPPFALPYGEEGSLYFELDVRYQHLVVTLSYSGIARDDRLLAQNFLQAFSEVKKFERGLDAAPTFSFSVGKPPTEMHAPVRCTQECGEAYDWASFYLQPNHVLSPSRISEVVQHLINFRPFLMFHIHRCRSAMHRVMRKRVDGFALTLNRARTNAVSRPRIQLS